MGPVERVLDRLKGVEQRGGYHVALCPAHDDEEPSLSVKEGEDGRALIKCFAGCSVEVVTAALELKMSDLFERRNGHRRVIKRYDYTDAEGQLLFQTLRFEPKDFKQRRPDGRGGWVWNLKGIEPVLYQLPEVLSTIEADETVYIVEGEQDAERLRSLGLVATTSPMGAGKWRSSYSQALRGAKVVVLPDNDGPGKEHAEQVVRSVQGKVVNIKVLELPGLPDKGDVSDWLNAGGTAEELSRLVKQTREWKCPDSDIGNPQTFTAADLMALELPPVRWAVPDIVPEGVTLLAGKPKLGKSWLTLGLGVATTTGGVALGTKRVERGECLYLALEDNQRRLQKRFSKLLAGGDAPVGLHIALEWRRLDEGGTEALDEWLEAHPDSRLVVIDTLKKVRPRTLGNRSVYDVDYEALEPLLPLASEHSVSIVVVHHTRKLAAADPLDEISGSTGLSGGVDGALVLKRDRGRADAYLHVTGRDIEEEQELALRWDPNTAGWCIVGDADEYRLGEERAAVVRVLKNAGGPLSPKDVAEALDKKGGAVRELLSQMVKSGEVESVGYGKYAVKSPDTPDSPDTQDVGDAQSVSGVSGVSVCEAPLTGVHVNDEGEAEF